MQKHDRVKILEKDTNMLGWWLGECKGKVCGRCEDVCGECAGVK